MRLVPGTVVDTPEGPRLLPPDIKGDGIDLDYVVQGFDIDQIEARLILGGKWDGNGASDDILDGIGGSQIGGKFSFKKMSEYTGCGNHFYNFRNASLYTKFLIQYLLSMT